MERWNSNIVERTISYWLYDQRTEWWTVWEIETHGQSGTNNWTSQRKREGVLEYMDAYSCMDVCMECSRLCYVLFKCNFLVLLLHVFCAISNLPSWLSLLLCNSNCPPCVAPPPRCLRPCSMCNQECMKRSMRLPRTFHSIFRTESVTNTCSCMCKLLAMNKIKCGLEVQTTADHVRV